MPARLVLLGSLCMTAHAVDPTIVWIGDPHLNQQTLQSPTYKTWINQTNWIAANQSTWNISAVLCAGDFWDGFQSDAWLNGWDTIDGLGIPYLTAVGNHDYNPQIGNQGSYAGRGTGTFDTQVGHDRISGKSWYGGFYDDGGSKANEYILFTMGGHDYIVIALEFYPRPVVIAWATGILNANPDRRAIVITHGYMNTSDGMVGGSLVRQGDVFGPSWYGMPLNSYSGVDLANWANGFANVRLIICGHETPPRFFQREDGHVLGIMSDYQDASPPSESIVLMQFASNDIVTVSNLNTTSGTLDTTTYPPFTVSWLWTPPEPGPPSNTAQISQVTAQ